MNEKELKMILEEGEGYKIEFKESLSGIDKEMVSFANSSGGRIFLGITDDSKIKGFAASNRLKSQIQDIASNCRPKVQIAFEKFENILIITVREGSDKPYECSEGFFKRLGPNSQKMTRNEIVDLFKSEGKIRFDELMEPGFNYPGDYDKNKLTEFIELGGLSKTAGSERILLSLNVSTRQRGNLHFNNSGILFFAKNPQSFIPWSVFTVVLFKDKQGTDVIDRKEVKGSLFEIVEGVMNFTRMYTKVAYRFTGKPQREEIYEYPFEAVREAVINSVMHKDYFEHGHNNILKFFPDKISIENIWRKPRHFILGRTVFRRNQVIADLFSRIHFGEKLGSGMQRIKEICKKDHSPLPKINFTETHFYITFGQNREYLNMAKAEESISTTPQVTLSGLEKQILEEIIKNPRISRNQIANRLKIGSDTIKEYIKRLRKKNILRRKGKTSGGWWKIKR